MDRYAKYFDKNSKCMNLLVNDKEIIESKLKYRKKLKG